MLQQLGPMGIVGLVIVLAGVGLIAFENLLIAAGIGLVLLGLGLVVKAMITAMVRSFGMF